MGQEKVMQILNIAEGNVVTAECQMEFRLCLNMMRNIISSVGPAHLYC